MPSARPFSSKGFSLVLIVAGLPLLAACSAGPSLVVPDKTAALRLAPAEEKLIVEEAVPPLPSAAKLKPQPAAHVSAELRDTVQPAEKSAWCEALREEAKVDALIMRSPTISGSLDDESRANLNLGLSYSSFRKADLIEASSEARCRRFLAEAGLQKLVFISPQGLTVAGFKAKSKAIMAQKKNIMRLRADAESLVQRGVISRDKAVNLQVQADRLIAEAQNAKSQADRRLEALDVGSSGAQGLTASLLRAEADLAEINSQIRTHDAMDVSLSAGWNDDLSQDGFNASSDSFAGKVNFTFKLGAVDPRRFEHEQRATAARLRAIKGEEGGTLWQVDALRRAHERAIEGLEGSRVKLDDAALKAAKLVQQLRSIPNPEFKATYIAARLQQIAIEAERAAAADSIREIRNNLKKLN